MMIRKGIENMEKIKLKDGTEIEIMNGATENCITVNCSTLEEVGVIADQLTDENLEKYKILNSAGLECATIENKHLESITIYPDKGQTQFNLADVDMVAKRLEALESGQELQDEAITELAAMAAGEEV